MAARPKAAQSITLSPASSALRSATGRAPVFKLGVLGRVAALELAVPLLEGFLTDAAALQMEASIAAGTTKGFVKIGSGCLELTAVEAAVMPQLLIEVGHSHVFPPPRLFRVRS